MPEASLLLLKVLSQKPTASSFVKMIGEGIGSVINTLIPDPDTNKPRPRQRFLRLASLAPILTATCRAEPRHNDRSATSNQHAETLTSN